MFQLRSTLPTKKAKDISAREERVYDALKLEGLSDETIAALLGNARQENSKFTKDEKSKAGAVGIFQLKGVLKNGYEDWLKENKQNDSIESQAAYVSDVIQNNYDGRYAKLRSPTGEKLQLFGHGNARYLRNSFENDNVLEQTRKFMDHFEQPGNDEQELNQRYRYAKDYLNQIRNYYKNDVATKKSNTYLNDEPIYGP